MTTELITIFAAILGSVVVVGLAVGWWMNRTPSFEKDERARSLPLFSSAGASDGVRLEISAWDDTDGTAAVDVGDDRADESDALVDASRWRAPDPWGAAPSEALLEQLRRALPTREVAAWAPAADVASVEPALPPSGSSDRTFAPDGAAADRPADRAEQPISSFAPAARARVPDLHAGFAPPSSSSGLATDALSSPTELPAPSRFAAPVGPSDEHAPPAPSAPPTDASSARKLPSHHIEEAVRGNGAAGRMVEGQLLRFSVPADGTLQFLPGRLEISSGLDAGREIRFVRVPGPNGTEVTFGRSEGELYRHVQLLDQTVSRTHARLRFKDERWCLLNLSKTNPVVLDGSVLSTEEDHLLEDGARIEMGEVVFTFRNR